MGSIYICGYSVHRQCDLREGQNGLGSYMVRLQAHGECNACVNGVNIKMSKGTLMTLGPSDSCFVTKEENPADLTDTSGDYFVMFQTSWAEKWLAALGDNKITRIHMDDTLIDLWNLLLKERRRPEENINPYQESLLYTFCQYVSRVIREKRDAKTGIAVLRMQRFIEEHATETFKVAEVADHVSLSESRALHLFKEATGKSIVDYQMGVRFQYALEQIRYTSLSLEEIADNCGFHSYSYFCRLFKRELGAAPRNFRQSHELE